MKLALGIYTEISESSPVPVFDRALSLMYEPVLYYIYNKPNQKISLYQSSAMMRHITKQRPEFKSLIATAAKRGDIELITGSYSQTVLSLIPPKERSSQIEKMTNQIRRDYGVLANIAFMYGQIWAPLYVSTLKNGGIDGVVISTYKATDKEHISDQSFVMNELGKRITVYSINDQVAALVSRYAQNELLLEELESQLIELIDGYKGKSLVVFLNIDQLLEGASRNGEESDVGSLVVHLMERYEKKLVHMRDLKITEPGYLDSGWYGRDAWASGLKSFNDIFVRNENFRYLFNRYISLTECGTRGLNRYIKKDIYRNLFVISTGSLFIHDAQCTPMRLSERRAFWGAIIDAENVMFEESETTIHKEYDLEEIGVNDFFSTNKTYTTVLSPKGGSICEFDYKPYRMNIMDTRVLFDKSFPKVSLNKSFSDMICIGEKEYFTESRIFNSEVLDRKRTDFQFTLSDKSIPVAITKRFRLRSTTFLCDVTVSNNSDKPIIGTYNSFVYLDSRDLELLGQDMRMDMFATKSVQARTVRYAYKNTGLQVILSSTSEYTLSEENITQSQYTSLGLEEFFLHKKLIFTFPMDVEANGTVSYRLVLRINEGKETTNVH